MANSAASARRHSLPPPPPKPPLPNKQKSGAPPTPPAVPKSVLPPPPPSPLAKQASEETARRRPPTPPAVPRDWATAACNQQAWDPTFAEVVRATTPTTVASPLAAPRPPLPPPPLPPRPALRAHPTLHPPLPGVVEKALAKKAEDEVAVPATTGKVSAPRPPPAPPPPKKTSAEAGKNMANVRWRLYLNMRLMELARLVVKI